jgi:integrase
VQASSDQYQGWGDAAVFAACTATRIGEVSGCRIGDIDTDTWVWMLRRQTTPGPGGMKDKGTKGKRARPIPIIEEVRPVVLRRMNAAWARISADTALTEADEDTRHNAFMRARLFVGPRGGRIATGVLRKATHWDEVVTKLGFEHLRRHDLRKATHWDEVVTKLGFEHLRRHDLRHTGLTWFADAGVPLHRLQRIAGHTDPRITQRYLHPDLDELRGDGDRLSRFLAAPGQGPATARQGRDGPKLVPKLRLVE